MIKLRLALDWTPNTNHIGFFIAQELGYYKQQGIELEIINPADDNYMLTPGKKLELDIADFAIAPFETVISLNNKPNRVKAVAVYAILQEDLSCIACLKSTGITSPKFLDGKSYASYKARYEDSIVREMIKNDGGVGDLQIDYPDKLGIWNTLISGQADSTWIFDNWEGIEAQSKGIELNKFTMSQYGIPYGYSPVVITKDENLLQHKDIYSKFIQATKSGFLFVENHLKESLIILQRYVPEHDLQNIDLGKSISATAPYFGNATDSGRMNKDRVISFLKWLTEKGLEDNKILDQKLFSNELIG